MRALALGSGPALAGGECGRTAGLSVCLLTSRSKKNLLVQQRQSLRVVIPPDGFLFQSHATQNEPNGLLHDLLMRQSIVDHARRGQV